MFKKAGSQRFFFHCREILLQKTKSRTHLYRHSIDEAVYKNLILLLYYVHNFFFDDGLYCAFWTQTQTRTLDLSKKTDPLKNGPVWKTGPQALKTLPFVSCHIKDYDEVIRFHTKSRMCARSHFLANNVWKVFRKFLLRKRRSWYKNDNCQFVFLISMKCSSMFTHFLEASFSIKTYFYETSNGFYLEY